MAKSNNEWVPEAGQECEFTCGSAWNKCEFMGRRSNGSILIVNRHGDYKEYPPSQIKFRPIKTEAEKRRDLAVDEMKALFHKLGCLPVNDGGKE